MERKKLLKFSLITLIISVAVLLLTYFFFHFVTDEGIRWVWSSEPSKPFVTYIIGIFGMLFLFSSAISLIVALVFTDKE